MAKVLRAILVCGVLGVPAFAAASGSGCDKNCTCEECHCGKGHCESDCGCEGNCPCHKKD